MRLGRRGCDDVVRRQHSLSISFSCIRYNEDKSSEGRTHECSRKDDTDVIRLPPGMARPGRERMSTHTAGAYLRRAHHPLEFRDLGVVGARKRCSSLPDPPACSPIGARVIGAQVHDEQVTGIQVFHASRRRRCDGIGAR